MNKENAKNTADNSPVPEIRFTHETTQAMAAEVIKSIPMTLTEFRCPICNRKFARYLDFRFHYTSDHPDSAVPEIIILHVNGKDCELLVEPHWTLQHTLQFGMGLTGSKHMCGKGACGSCTVIIEGRAVLSCIILAVECEGQSILSIEGMSADPKWKPLIDAYCRWDAMQCGYCTPGFLVTAKALLDKNPNPTEEEIRAALSGNICICGTYPRHSTAIMEAASIMSKGN